MNNIDILEEYIKELNKNKKIDPSAYGTGFGKYWSDFGVAIETLIAENKELKEKIKEIKEEYSAEQKYEMENTIPKSKIKAKIEEVKEDENPSISSFQEYAQEYAIDKLQSLLGKE